MGNYKCPRTLKLKTNNRAQRLNAVTDVTRNAVARKLRLHEMEDVLVEVRKGNMDMKFRVSQERIAYNGELLVGGGGVVKVATFFVFY